MSKRAKLTTDIKDGPHGFDVIWRENGRIVGAVPIKLQATAELLKELLDRGIAPVDAVYRALKPKRRQSVGHGEDQASKYGRMGVAARNARMSPERRKEIALKAAAARWGKADPTAMADKEAGQ